MAATDVLANHTTGATANKCWKYSGRTGGEAVFDIAIVQANHAAVCQAGNSGVTAGTIPHHSVAKEANHTTGTAAADAAAVNLHVLDHGIIAIDHTCQCTGIIGRKAGYRHIVQVQVCNDLTGTDLDEHTVAGLTGGGSTRIEFCIGNGIISAVKISCKGHGLIRVVVAVNVSTQDDQLPLCSNGKQSISNLPGCQWSKSSVHYMQFENRWRAVPDQGPGPGFPVP